MPQPTSVSVIVCTRDRPADFARLLPTLLATDPQPLEIIVIDQSSNAATKSIVDGASAPHTRLIHQQTSSRGLSRARNEGLRIARGDVCAFTDDDCTVAANWVGWVATTFERYPDVGLAFGRMAAAPHDPAESFVPVFEPRRFRRVSSFGLLLQSGAGGNMAIRRELFDRVGVFDESLGAGARLHSGEDTDLAYRIARAGYGVLQDPAGVVLHWGARPWAGGTARQLIAHGYFGIGVVLSKHARRGDWQAAASLAPVTALIAGPVLLNVLRLHKPLGLRRLTSLASGVRSGWQLTQDAS